VSAVSATLRTENVPAAQLRLEITEGVFADASAVEPVLAGLKALGVSLSIDDFGTGYSSLSRLRRLQVDELKIDRSFVEGLGDDGEAHAVVTAIVSLGAALGLEVVAEGVEHPAQLQALAQLGCARAQGFYLARPKPANVVAPLLRAERQVEIVIGNPS
jgi:EAL domain-containing protein (putative c-di-GMP-specific phosphodiesterase class I)